MNGIELKRIRQRVNKQNYRYNLKHKGIGNNTSTHFPICSPTSTWWMSAACIVWYVMLWHGMVYGMLCHGWLTYLLAEWQLQEVAQSKWRMSSTFKHIAESIMPHQKTHPNGMTKRTFCGFVWLLFHFMYYESAFYCKVQFSSIRFFGATRSCKWFVATSALKNDLILCLSIA